MIRRAVLALALCTATAAAEKPRRPRRGPVTPPAPAAPAKESSKEPPLSIDLSEAPTEDVDVSTVPAPKPPPPGKGRTTAAAPPAPAFDPSRPVSGDDGEAFRLRGTVAAAAFRYEEDGLAPLQMRNGYLNVSLEISRRIFSVWELAIALDTPTVAIESTAPANFGPLYGRFSFGRSFRLGDRWDGTAYLSYLFLTAAGTRAGFGYTDVSGILATFRARFRAAPLRRLELELGAGLLGSMQSGVQFGDRLLAFQVSFLWLGDGGSPAFGPFAAVDEVRASFTAKNTTGVRYRVGLQLEL